MDKAVYEEMFQLEMRHWWFAAKRRIVLALLERHLRLDRKGKRSRVADVGCGCGMMLIDLIASRYDAVGVDTSDLALQFCRARNVPVVRGDLQREILLPAGSVDAVLMLDVLEHIENDKEAWRVAVELTKPGGIIICTVPAYRWLWAPRDKFHHHKRRYSREEFLDVLRSASNTEIQLISFMNTFLFPLALIGRLIEKAFGRRDRPTDLSIPPLGLNQALRAAFQTERYFLSRGISFPYGLSLVAAVRKLSSPQRESLPGNGPLQPSS